MSIRLLHTSDWHLGRTIRNRPRTEEFAEPCSPRSSGSRATRASTESSWPGTCTTHGRRRPEADAILVEALVKLHEAAIPVVAIGGNHDSARRLEAFAPLYAAVGATVVGNGSVRPDAGGVVELTARGGGTSRADRVRPVRAGAVVRDDAAPCSTPPRAGTRPTPTAWAGSWTRSPRRSRRDRVNVLMAHLYADGVAARGRRARGHRRAGIRRLAGPPAGHGQLPRPGPHPSPAAGRRDGRARGATRARCSSSTSARPSSRSRSSIVEASPGTSGGDPGGAADRRAAGWSTCAARSTR